MLPKQVFSLSADVVVWYQLSQWIRMELTVGTVPSVKQPSTELLNSMASGSSILSTSFIWLKRIGNTLVVAPTSAPSPLLLAGPQCCGSEYFLPQDLIPTQRISSVGATNPNQKPNCVLSASPMHITWTSISVQSESQHTQQGFRQELRKGRSLYLLCSLFTYLVFFFVWLVGFGFLRQALSLCSPGRPGRILDPLASDSQVRRLQTGVYHYAWFGS